MNDQLAKQQPNNMKKRSFLKRFLWFCAISTAAVLILAASTIVMLELSLPNVQKLKDVHLQVPLRILTQDHKLIAEFGEIRRIPVTIQQVPKLLIYATLATEDQRFFTHPGVDFLGLARAGIILITTGKKEQGGSTITMQVARNFFLTRKKTYTRKLREILLALKIDREFSKDKILELYFNKNFYGQRAYGIGAAANIYYGETLNQLTLPQMAMLAGIPKAPSALNPLSNPKAAKDRRDHVLYRMYDLHYIDKATYEKAIDTPLTAKYHGLKVSVTAPYIAEMARQLMVDQFGKSAYERGFTVYTTINSQLQEEANHAVTKGLLAYDKRHGYRGTIKNLGNPPDDLTQWINALKQQPTINGLQPALILTVSDQSATALLKDGTQVTIPWRGLSWARKQILAPNDKEYLGAQPTQASDVVKMGDLIYVFQDDSGTWSLDQIPAAEAALVALNPKNGAILSLTGGFNYFKSNYNRITQAMRQPGSAFKPFIYSAALEKRFTLASVINDAPVVIPNSGGENSLWRPENDTRLFYGPTRLRVALMKSRNLVSVRLLQLIGIHYAINYATRFGFQKNQLPNALSLALGAATITPLQLATGYAVFANGGYYVKPYFVDHITGYQNNPVFQSNPPMAGDPIKDDTNNIDANSDTTPRVITAQNAYLLTSAMKDVIRHGTGRPALVLHRPDLAGKTGTTNNQHDAWFSGFDSNLVATAWIGFDQPQSLHEYAVKAALPIWIDFMGSALKNYPEASMPQPKGIVTARIDKKTGRLASPTDTNVLFELFRQNHTPKQQSSSSSSNNNNNNQEISSSEEANLNQLY